MRRALKSWLYGERAVLAVFGLHAIYMTFVLGWEAMSGTERFPNTGIWVMLYALAGVSCFAYHRFPTSDMAWRWSGVALVGAHASRATLNGLYAVSHEWTPAVAVSIGAWVAIASAAGLVWLRYLTPWRT